jgi:hypothetical protein
MKEVPCIRHIMVVGGFGSSKVLTQRIRTEFRDDGGVQVVCCERPNLLPDVVAQGAVSFGLHKDIMQSRVSQYTYGVAVQRDGVGEIFNVLVTKGEELPHDHIASMTAYLGESNHEGLKWRVYRSDKVSPTTVTGEHYLGCVTADCPPDPIRANRRLTAVFCFGGSEIRVTIVNAKKEAFRGGISMV